MSVVPVGGPPDDRIQLRPLARPRLLRILRTEALVDL